MDLCVCALEPEALGLSCRPLLLLCTMPREDYTSTGISKTNQLHYAGAPGILLVGRRGPGAAVAAARVEVAGGFRQLFVRAS